MATTIVFALVDALVTRLRAQLPGVQVYDGFGLSDDPGDFLMVGVEDPDAQASATAAESEQSWAGLGAKARDETGSVTCAALSWNGNPESGGSQQEARAGVKAITDAIENHLRADPNLGGTVPGLMWTGFGTRFRLVQDQTDSGAMALAVFEIAFKARI